MRDKNEGTHRGEEVMTPRLVQKIAEGETSYELSWKVKMMKKERKTYAGNG